MITNDFIWDEVNEYYDDNDEDDSFANKLAIAIGNTRLVAASVSYDVMMGWVVSIDIGDLTYYLSKIGSDCQYVGEIQYASEFSSQQSAEEYALANGHFL
jgi:hypothetical protein